MGKFRRLWGAGGRVLRLLRSRALSCCDTIPKSVTTGDGSASGSGLSDVHGGLLPVLVCRSRRSRRVGGIFAKLLRVDMDGLADIGIYWGFSPICGGLDTLHRAQGGAIKGNSSQSQGVEQRNADERSRWRWSMDAPSRRHQPPPCRVWGHWWVSARGQGDVRIRGPPCMCGWRNGLEIR